MFQGLFLVPALPLEAPLGSFLPGVCSPPPPWMLLSSRWVGDRSRSGGRCLWLHAQGLHHPNRVMPVPCPPQPSQDVLILGAGRGVMMAEGLLIGEGHPWGHWSVPSPILGDKIMLLHPLAGFALGCYSWLHPQLLPKALLGDDHGVRGEGSPCVHPRSAQEPHPRAGVSAL